MSERSVSPPATAGARPGVGLEHNAGSAPGRSGQADMRLAEPVLEVSDFSVAYGGGGQRVRAVEDVTLTLRRGEVLGLAGESGSGKSTLAFAMNRLLRPPGRITSGSVHYSSRSGQRVDLLRMTGEDLRLFRWREVAMVFQSAMNALNPVLSLRAQILDTLRAHGRNLAGEEGRAKVAELLGLVGITADRAGAFPHELSGGMRQRAMITMALALEPEIIIMDEPTTALDVVVQRQILSVIMRLRERLGFSVLFITHDLSLLLEMADRIAVMYAGRVVELSAADELLRRPRHPYSYGLLHSFPTLHGPRVELAGIPGWPPDLRNPPPGCPFHPRCPHAQEPCRSRSPRLLRQPGHGRVDPEVACLIYEDNLLGPVPAELAEPRAPEESKNVGSS
jgi:oligopeptide/dipeptide ABC transporter ATP-binding protein